VSIVFMGAKETKNTELAKIYSHIDKKNCNLEKNCSSF